jgi:hypothetical protein
MGSTALVTFPPPGEDHFSGFLYFSGHGWIIFFRKKNSFGLGGPLSILSWTVGKEGWKGTKKKFNFFHRTCGMCGDLTTQPHVRRTCGPVRHPYCRFSVERWEINFCDLKFVGFYVFQLSIFIVEKHSLSAVVHLTPQTHPKLWRCSPWRRSSWFVYDDGSTPRII